MRTQSVNNIVRKFILGSTLLLAVFLFGQSNAIAANYAVKNNSSHNINKPNKIFIKYAGSNTDGLFFTVKYNNEKGLDFDILITDEYGETLYEGSFSDKIFDKKFLLPEDSDASLVTISVKTGNDNFVKSYSIDSDIVKNVVVTKN